MCIFKFPCKFVDSDWLLATNTATTATAGTGRDVINSLRRRQ